MVDAVKYPSLAPSIFPASSKKYEVVHYRDGRRRPSGWPILGVFFNIFLKFIQFFAIKIQLNCLIGLKEFVVENFLPIPPKRKHNLLLMKVCFWVYIWWIMIFLSKLLQTINLLFPATNESKKWSFFSRPINKLQIRVQRTSWAPVRWPRRVRHSGLFYNNVSFCYTVNNPIIIKIKCE